MVHNNNKEGDTHYGLIAAEIAHIGVFLVGSDDYLLDVIQMMDSKKISAVVVEDMEDFSNYYLVSHSDIIHFFAQERTFLDYLGVVAGGRELMQNVKVRDIMRGPLEIIPKDTPIDVVIYKMNERGYKRIVVGNEYGQPIGVISTKDILTWNSEVFKEGTPILVFVLDNRSGIILAHKLFQEDFKEDLMDLFGGTLSAIEAITDEVLGEASGDLYVIEKDHFHIMLEQISDVTAVLIVDRSSIKLRRRLEDFLEQFVNQYRLELASYYQGNGDTSVFKIRELAQIFKQ